MITASFWNHGALIRSSRGGACTLPTRTTTAMPFSVTKLDADLGTKGLEARSRRTWRNPSMRKEAQPLRRRGISSGKKGDGNGNEGEVPCAN